MSEHAATRVRQFLLDAGFTADGVLGRVGSAAFGALGRGLMVPIRRSLAEPVSQPNGDGFLDRLVELFLLADPIPADTLPEAILDDLVALGMLRRDADQVVPLVEVHPYGEPDTDWYLVSDIGAPAEPDHVLGLGGASLTLARITPRRDVGRALDLGCGNGVQVLHAARHAGRVVATDTNPRALAMAALSTALSGLPVDQVDLREGSLFGPVADERFDLVVSNPPFVISPSHRFTYRDAGLSGDELSRLVVRGAAAHLAPGGRAAVLGNWLHVAGEEWTDRVSEWVAGTGASAWVVERDSQPIADYAATWLRDAGLSEGHEFDAAMGEWLDAFGEEGCQAVGFGWFVLAAADADADADREREAADPTERGERQATDRAEPEPEGPTRSAEPAEQWVLVEDLSSSERLPTGDEVAAFIAGCQAVESVTAPELLAAPLRLVDGATVTTTTHVSAGALVDAPPRLGLAGVVGPGGWRPAVPVPPALLAALLADSGEPIGRRLDEAAQAEGLEPLDVLGPALMSLRDLIRLGIVRTAG